MGDDGHRLRVLPPTRGEPDLKDEGLLQVLEGFLALGILLTAVALGTFVTPTQADDIANSRSERASEMLDTWLLLQNKTPANQFDAAMEDWFRGDSSKLQLQFEALLAPGETGQVRLWNGVEWFTLAEKEGYAEGSSSEARKLWEAPWSGPGVPGFVAYGQTFASITFTDPLGFTTDPSGIPWATVAATTGLPTTAPQGTWNYTDALLCLLGCEIDVGHDADYGGLALYRLELVVRHA